MRTQLVGLISFILLFGSIQTANANLVELVWTTTSSSMDGSFSAIGVTGEDITTTITVDNGGTSIISQSWSANDFVSYRIEGSSGWWIETNFISTATSSGYFSTDSTGDVVSAGTWIGGYFYGGTITTSWAGVIDGGFWNNGFNQVVAADNPYGGVWVTAVSENLIGRSWSASLADTSAVPEPETMLLFGVGIAALAAVGRRRMK